MATSNPINRLRRALQTRVPRTRSAVTRSSAVASAQTTSHLHRTRSRQTNTRSPPNQSLLRSPRHRSTTTTRSGGRSRTFENGRMLSFPDIGEDLDGLNVLINVITSHLDSHDEDSSDDDEDSSDDETSGETTDWMFDGFFSHLEDLGDYYRDLFEDDFFMLPPSRGTNEGDARQQSRARRRRRGRIILDPLIELAENDSYEDLLEFTDALGNVSKGLTQEEINLLPTQRFSRALRRRTNGILSKDCRICITEYKSGEVLRILPCFHDFHAPCIDKWLLENNTCPICRNEIEVN